MCFTSPREFSCLGPSSMRFLDRGSGNPGLIILGNCTAFFTIQIYSKNVFSIILGGVKKKKKLTMVVLTKIPPLDLLLWHYLLSSMLNSIESTNKYNCLVIPIILANFRIINLLHRIRTLLLMDVALIEHM